MPSILEAAQREALKAVQTDTPQQFTVGAYIDASGQLRGIATYDRKWSNGWGLTAYAKAYWLDLSVTAHPKLEAGAQVVKKF